MDETDPVVREVVQFTPATKEGTDDLRLEPIEVIKAKANNEIRRWVYLLGAAILGMTIIACVYIVLNATYPEKVDDRAWTLLTLIVGAVLSTIYNNSSHE